MDVTEIDAVVLGSAAFTGGIGGIGAGIRNTSGQVGSVSGTLQYQESPTIRYQPLLGQALITQLSTPLTVDALSNIISSGWDPLRVLSFGLDRVTPGSIKDGNEALELIDELWGHNALIISSGKAKAPDTQMKTEAGIGNISIQLNNNTNTSGSEGGAGSQPDSLVLYFHPRSGKDEDATRKWNRLETLYHGTQPKEMPPNQIFLRTKPEPLGTQPKENPRIPLLPPTKPEPLSSLGPVIQTRSALGVLKTATQLYHQIKLVTPEEYRRYMYEEKCERKYKDRYGVFDPCNVPYHRLKSPRGDKHPDDMHFLLIIYSTTPPSSRTYVSHFDPSSGFYYYIADDDCLSKDSFVLINLFLTIQAIPGSPPLTPTISVGSRSGS
jgi:hypothetical protein